jgi:hypothetical protein
MTTEEISQKLKSLTIWWTTKRGTRIIPYHSESPAVITRKGDLQLCQIMPPIPQRFEWIKTSNIVEHRA